MSAASAELEPAAPLVVLPTAHKPQHRFRSQQKGASGKLLASDGVSCSSVNNKGSSDGGLKGFRTLNLGSLVGSSPLQPRKVTLPPGSTPMVLASSAGSSPGPHIGGTTRSAYSASLVHLNRPALDSVTSAGGYSLSPGSIPMTQTVSQYYFDKTSPSPPPPGADAAEANRRQSRAGDLPPGAIHSEPKYRNYKGPGVLVDSNKKISGPKFVVREYTLEHEIRVPKKTWREDIIEKTILVPERILIEDIVEETKKVYEKIVEVARPVIQERIVEVPYYSVVEKTVEVPEKIIREKIVTVPSTQYVERRINVPKIITQEKTVEMPVYEYRDVPVESVVEVPEIHEEVVYKHIPVPRYVSTPVREDRVISEETEISRLVPIPVEATTNLELRLPQIHSKYTSVPVPVYVPRFIEVPVCVELCDEQFLEMAERCSRAVVDTVQPGGEISDRGSSEREGVSLTALERTAELVQQADFEGQFRHQKCLENLANWWQRTGVSVDSYSIMSICQTQEVGGTETEAVSMAQAKKEPSVESSSVLSRSSSAVHDIERIVLSESGQNGFDIEESDGDAPEAIESGSCSETNVLLPPRKDSHNTSVDEEQPYTSMEENIEEQLDQMMNLPDT